VAAVLVGAQVATALLAVALSAVFAEDRSRELLEGTLRLRLDAVAEEVESRAEIDPFGGLDLPGRLRADLPTRFPDPLAVLDETGAVLDTFGGAVRGVPEAARRALADGRVAVVLDGPEGSWGLAPLLAPDGLPAGALLVRPLDRTLAEERRGTRTAFRQATVATVVLAVTVALLLGALFSARLIRPVRDVTRRVERLGEGDYSDRLPVGSGDELGRLAQAVNEMAGRVEASLDDRRETDRLRRELVANVGHDLRTPLAALRALLDEAERFASEGRAGDAAAATEDARRQAEAAGALVADLFELSVLDRPAPALRLGPVPLGELLRDVAGRHAGAFRQSEVALAVEAPPGLPAVKADGARLVRLLSNLLDNARRHTPPGGTVRLAARADANAVTVEVEDTGPGIDPDVLPHVFERYYRGTDARTRRAGGTGLGLAIARAIAEAHGGRLEAESLPDAGARFRLTLPLGRGLAEGA
jgi:signal transduction histidine kinase